MPKRQGNPAKPSYARIYVKLCMQNSGRQQLYQALQALQPKSLQDPSYPQWQQVIVDEELKLHSGTLPLLSRDNVKTALCCFVAPSYVTVNQRAAEVL